MIFTSTTSNAPTTAAFWWIWSGLGGSGHIISHSSVDILTHHGQKCHRLIWKGSLISSRKSRFSSWCSTPRSRGTVFSINKLRVLGLRRPKYFLKVQAICLRDKVRVHVLCLEAKFRYNHILIQGPELKYRACALSQSTSKTREMLSLEEPRIIQLWEETQLVIAVQLNILSRKIREFSDSQLILYLIHNLKVRSMYNKN